MWKLTVTDSYSKNHHSLKIVNYFKIFIRQNSSFFWIKIVHFCTIFVPFLYHKSNFYKKNFYWTESKPSPPQLIHPPPGYHGKVLPVAMPHQYQHQQQYNPELRDRGGTELCDDEDEDDDDTTPIIESCCFCCNLGIGILLGAISYLVSLSINCIPIC